MSVDFQNLPHPGIRSLIPYKPGKSIDELKKEKGLNDIIKMASNENPLGCSPLALQAIKEMSSLTLATYPSPLNHPLMRKLSESFGLTPEHLFLSNGSDCIFGLLIKCFALHLGKHILTHDFAFSAYTIQAHTLQVPVQTVPIQENWQVDIEKIINACTTQTGLIFIANPNNPTGLLISPLKIRHLLDNIPPTTLLVLDEAYYEYAAAELGDNSIGWLADYPNLIITRTFSKLYGMAGVRLGYALAHPDIINILTRVQLPFAVNQIALQAAYAALDDDEFIQKSLTSNKAGMEYCEEQFKSLNFNYLTSAANFLTFNCTEDGIKLYNYLLDRGIIIRPLHPYNMPNYLRVSIGTKEQNQRFFMELTNYKNLK
ncbi:histidinol-phosphate transaminase [Legionella sp. km772]|uniref:histidinol-phosphate transaminase n=1 Tax=Legionella sp. km772 TaxID=2498111 RepID=UPI000F8CABD8|nr:histidinol-phosphate transaminase [Legionella sp. km772]RUR06467.1 histidinol-phosphate transaminase [Legionella sp. km772]